jgi:beta-lactamase regulating signal transducer with metallopeptidase domain
MIADALSILVEITVATSIAVIVVALTIAPVRRMSGPQVAYWLWLLVPASALVVLLPLPPEALDAAQFLAPAVAGAFTVERTFKEGVQNGAIYPTVALVIWACGLLLALTLMVIRQKLFTRSLRNLVLGADGTYRCAGVTGPLLIGLRRARIIVPLDFDTRYDPEEQALIVAHERAHRQRGDILGNAIAGAWLCVFWFNPLMYWAAIRLRVDQDLACDASVLRSSGAGPLRYAQLLLKAQLADGPPLHVPMTCQWRSAHPLRERIVMLRHSYPGSARRRLGIALTVAVILAGTGLAWAAQPESSQSDELHVGSLRVTISADYMSKLPNGDIVYSGNVTLTTLDPGTSPSPLRWSSETVDELGDGSMVLNGTVRVSFGSYVVIAEHAVYRRQDATFRMDSARLSNESHTG